jgi:hypothetical protein
MSSPAGLSKGSRASKGPSSAIPIALQPNLPRGTGPVRIAQIPQGHPRLGQGIDLSCLGTPASAAPGAPLPVRTARRGRAGGRVLALCRRFFPERL